MQQAHQVHCTWRASQDYRTRSGSFFFSKLALAELPPFSVVLGPVAIAALALTLVVRATGRRMPRSPKVWGQFLVMGVLNNLIPFSLIFWGQTHIGSGLASILNATTPLWTVLLALLVDRPWTLPGQSAQHLGALAGLGLLSTALAYVLYFSLLACVGATNALLVTLLIPAGALLLAAAVLGEALDLRHLLGMALIGLGLLVMAGRLFIHILPKSRQARAKRNA